MQDSFRRKIVHRKIVFGVALVVLMLLLYSLGRPAHIVSGTGGEVSFAPGGVLAQFRSAEGLAEVDMGELDPASTTAKLATFGMRGVAIALLWHRAMEQQKRHQWNDVVATGNQIIFLEPHFVTIWDFLGWSLAYNASATFDDYRERYRWVIRGIDFLLNGLKKNQNSPRLHRSVGWTISQKIGIADEVEQYRRLLRDDEAFGNRHDAPLPSDRDNWLLGRRWYHLGEDLVLRGISLGNESDFIYFANSRLNLFNYAKWKRRDGIFGDEAIKAWENARDEWRHFGTMELATAIPTDGTFRVLRGTPVHRARLETTDLIQERERELLDELYNISPGLRESLALERWHQLGQVPGQQGSLLPLLEQYENRNPRFYPVQELNIIRQWLDENEPQWQTRLAEDRDSLIPESQTALRAVPPLFLEEEDRAALGVVDGEISQVYYRAMDMLWITPSLLAGEIQEIADVSREQRGRARAIVAELDTHRDITRMSNLFRGILNYEARFREVAVETTTQADQAQQLRYNARIAYYDGRLSQALNGWLDAMRKWDEILDLEEFSDRASDPDFVRDHVDIANRLLIILDDSNKIFSSVSGDPVPLHRIMRHRVFSGHDEVTPLIEALEYAKKEYEQALAEPDTAKRLEVLERVEEYFLTVAHRFQDMKYREKYMEYAPFFDVRDGTLESVAYYIRALQAQGKAFPEPLILRAYIELMLLHDPAVATANTILFEARPLIEEGRYAEAYDMLNPGLAAWQMILERYPIIEHDPTNSAYFDVSMFARLYAGVLQSQNKPIPEDFPLRKFLP